MILGTGIDIIEIERVERAASKQGFVSRILTHGEKEYWESKGCAVQTLAGFFAAKEAISKAFGTGIGQIGFHDMEILHRESGAPQAHMRGAAAELMARMGAAHVVLSISHSKYYAVAQAILEAKE